MPRITLEQMKNLQPGDILHHVHHRNADKTPMQWRVAENPKTWRLDPLVIKVKVTCGEYLRRWLSFWELDVYRLTAADATAARQAFHDLPA